MNGNFFTWIRDGVRQSVIMGVSDAIEQLGTPPETKQESGSAVLAFLQNDASARRIAATTTTAMAATATATVTVPRGRKRLGRSLKEIETPQ